MASTQATVLVRGESGSGKELVARAIHFSSPRKGGPFVTLNCAALTETLLESELFGHEQRRFTGATEKMIGKFEAADKGTIFLDEIGEMALGTQSKFLRVLEGHPFERVGGNNPIKVNVRVVAATNQPLEQNVRGGTFRRDLFFRLQVVEIRVAPLRERPGDVSILADHFLKRFVRETGRRIKGFTPAALDEAGANTHGREMSANSRTSSSAPSHWATGRNWTSTTFGCHRWIPNFRLRPRTSTSRCRWKIWRRRTSCARSTIRIGTKAERPRFSASTLDARSQDQRIRIAERLMRHVTSRNRNPATRSACPPSWPMHVPRELDVRPGLQFCGIFGRRRTQVTGDSEEVVFRAGPENDHRISRQALSDLADFPAHFDELVFVFLIGAEGVLLILGDELIGGQRRDRLRRCRGIRCGGVIADDRWQPLIADD